LALTCLCGCPETRHEHFRDGTDCGTCGYPTCPYYRPVETYRDRLVVDLLVVALIVLVAFALASSPTWW
jgi:hypothetical protein